MSKKLVTYFSASGVTRNVSQNLASAIGADLFEIVPETPYTPEDLNWRDKGSRASVEMNDKSFRPPVAAGSPNLEGVDVVFAGFPIWWGTAPTIVATFLESLNLEGKTLVLFATSGSSGMGKSASDLTASAPSSAIVVEGKILKADMSAQELSGWVEGLGV